MKALDVRGFMIELKNFFTDPEGQLNDYQREAWNAAVKKQGSQEITLNRERLAKTLFTKWQNIKKDILESRWDDLNILWKNPWYELADAIIAAEADIIESPKKDGK